MPRSPAPRPRVSAHRGGTEHARPATYEAYEHAATTGAEYAEFDIRRTRDGELVVFHDATVRDVAGCGPVRPLAELSYAELRSAAGYEVPLAGSVMRLLARHGVAGHLDLKETGYEADVVALAVAAFGADGFVVTTLEDVSVSAIKTEFRQVTTALSLGRDLGEVAWRQRLGVRAAELAPLARVRRCGADWVAVNYKLARVGVTRACQRAGVGVMVWTVDGDASIDDFLRDDRIEVLITSRPAYAVARRAAVKSPG
ncbi:MAG: glycerophosphodiester phosphodiesterase [Streptosporangiaceae bacterium]